MALGSVTGRNLALDCMYGATKASISPATVYGHLYVGDPTAGGFELTSQGLYAPIALTNNGTNFPAASGGQQANGATWSFPVSNGAWSGQATFFYLTDAIGCTPPGILTLGQSGTTGSTPYSYAVTAVNGSGETTASPTGTTTTGNATLSGSNYNTIAWTAVSGASTYNVYKLVSGVWRLLANTASTSYHDTGGSTTAQVPPSVNTTSNLLDGGPTQAPIVVVAAGTLVEFPPGSITIGQQ
jgi:hypothetical protein